MSLLIHARSPRRARRGLLAAALPAVVAAIALGGGTAHAATANMDAGTLNHRGAAGENNRVTITDSTGATVRVTDTAGLRAGVGCLQISSTSVDCGQVQRLDVRTGDGTDTYVARSAKPTFYDAGSGNDGYRWEGSAAGVSTRVEFKGNTGVDRADYTKATAGVLVSKDNFGNDGRFSGALGRTIDRDNIRDDVERLDGSRFGDSLNGRNGATTVKEFFVGGAGNDLLAGNEGPDHFDMGPVADGADDVRGGNGLDEVDYSKRTNRITAAIDQSNADGEAGEGDDLKATEVIRGTPQGDAMNVVPSSTLPVQFFGGDGSDILLGGAGKDLLDGGPKEDVLSAKGGNDTIRSADGDRDFVLCGSESDSVLIDLTENQVDECETIDFVR